MGNDDIRDRLTSFKDEADRYGEIADKIKMLSLQLNALDQKLLGIRNVAKSEPMTVKYYSPKTRSFYEYSISNNGAIIRIAEQVTLDIIEVAKDIKADIDMLIDQLKNM